MQRNRVPLLANNGVSGCPRSNSRSSSRTATFPLTSSESDGYLDGRCRPRPLLLAQASAQSRKSDNTVPSIRYAPPGADISPPSECFMLVDGREILAEERRKHTRRWEAGRFPGPGRLSSGPPHKRGRTGEKASRERDEVREDPRRTPRRDTKSTRPRRTGQKAGHR